MTTKIICPKCKGSGKVMDPIWWLCPPMALMGMFIDAIDDGDVTKKDCPICEGTVRFDLDGEDV